MECCSRAGGFVQQAAADAATVHMQVLPPVAQDQLQETAATFPLQQRLYKLQVLPDAARLAVVYSTVALQRLQDFSSSKAAVILMAPAAGLLQHSTHTGNGTVLAMQ